MAISLSDLDQMLGYDPATHTVGSIPTMRSTKEPGTVAGGGATVRTPTQAAANAANFGIGAVGNRTEHPTASPFSAGIPSLGATAAPQMPQSEPQSIPALNAATAGEPQLQKPKTPWQKIEHGLARAGNIAGDIVAPGTMTLIPGTDLHNEFEEQRQAKLGEERARTNLENEEGDLVTVTDPTTGQQITLPARFAGSLQGKALTTEGAEKRTEEQQAGANTRVGEQQAGANQRVGEQQAGANERNQNTVAGANERTQETNDTRKTIADLNRQYMGTFEPSYDPQTGQLLGFYNSKNPANQRGPQGEAAGGAGGASPLAGGTTGQGARMEQMNQNRFNTQYVNQANQTEQQYQRANEAVTKYNNDPKTGAAGMVIFAQHLGTTLGGIKGAAIGEGAQKMHQDALGLADKAQRYIDYLRTGQPLSKNQVNDFMDLIRNTRQLQWETTAREAARRQMPIDFLPADVSIRMTSPDGKETQEVPAGRVQEFVGKGGKIGY